MSVSRVFESLGQLRGDITMAAYNDPLYVSQCSRELDEVLGRSFEDVYPEDWPIIMMRLLQRLEAWTLSAAYIDKAKILTGLRHVRQQVNGDLARAVHKRVVELKSGATASSLDVDCRYTLEDKTVWIQYVIDLLTPEATMIGSNRHSHRLPATLPDKTNTMQSSKEEGEKES